MTQTFVKINQEYLLHLGSGRCHYEYNIYQEFWAQVQMFAKNDALACRYWRALQLPEKLIKVLIYNQKCHCYGKIPSFNQCIFLVLSRKLHLSYNVLFFKQRLIIIN